MTLSQVPAVCEKNIFHLLRVTRPVENNTVTGYLSGEESGRALKLMNACNFPMKITKQGAQSLWMKMRNAELYLKGEELLRLAAACSEIARTCRKLASKLEGLDCSLWFYSEDRRKYQSKLATDHSSGEQCNEII